MLQDVVKFLNDQLKPGESVAPTQLCNLMTKFADQHGEAYYGDEIFWLEYFGYMSPFPHVWKGQYVQSQASAGVG